MYIAILLQKTDFSQEDYFFLKEKFPYISWLKPLHEQPAFIKAFEFWGWDF